LRGTHKKDSCSGKEIPPSTGIELKFFDTILKHAQHFNIQFYNLQI